MSHKDKNIILGISIGDLNGIGAEVILKSLEDNRILELCTPVIFGNSKPLSYIKKAAKISTAIHGIDALDQIVIGKVNVLHIWKTNTTIEFGKNDPEIGALALTSFTTAVAALKEGQIDILVTAPINKYNIQSDAFKHPGHTDYLNEQLEGEALMLLVHDNLRVGLLTDHLPLKEVAQALTPDLIERKIRTINNSLIRDFNILKPRIALLGLNPHSGDDGVIGNEEQVIMTPTLNKLFNQGILVSGPFAADGFFGSDTYLKFDAIVACYHDQGLIPFKTLSFGNGVNFTAGLNKIRTSPDHGTAYDIAGKGIANESSFREAIYTALDLYRNRLRNDEAMANRLQTQQKQITSKKSH